MINVRQSLRRNNNRTADINISPLIDLVFLLLIFFMVTTSFVKETGIEVERPEAGSATMAENSTILVAVTKDGEVFFDRQRVDVRTVRSHIAQALVENPGGEVIVVADKFSHTGVIVQVMDQCRLAGAKQVHLAADNGHE
ncbi:biopolymer transporter ExbD [uncultured Desulfuromonas sp.]|uniref:ExbD/TolR family protein n=1 Tax=uncultured Desulfuromonas sp. TaxID=181013 RepID=UPI002AAA71F6|nr:biopolymer transporter ExbD [uncultured Desulfuromonas sp.]